MEQAGRLQAANRESEAQKTWDNYDDDSAKRAIVYTREDATLIVSLLDSANAQIKNSNRILTIIANILFIIVIVLIYFCYKIL
jgi:hypothetical protein